MTAADREPDLPFVPTKLLRQAPGGNDVEVQIWKPWDDRETAFHIPLVALRPGELGANSRCHVPHKDKLFREHRRARAPGRRHSGRRRMSPQPPVLHKRWPNAHSANVRSRPKAVIRGKRFSSFLDPLTAAV